MRERLTELRLRDFMLKRMIESGLVDRTRLLSFYEQIEPELGRYAAIHAPAFRARVERTIRGA